MGCGKSPWLVRRKRGVRDDDARAAPGPRPTPSAGRDCLVCGTEPSPDRLYFGHQGPPTHSYTLATPTAPTITAADPLPDDLRHALDRIRASGPH